MSAVHSASIGPISLTVTTNGTGESVCCKLIIRRRLLKLHAEESRCRFLQRQASRDPHRPAARYSRLLAQPRAPRACRIAGMSQFALTSSHKLASTLSTHGRPLPPRAMDDEPPKRTSATRPRERLRAGWNVRINAFRARVHVMSIEGVAGMHGSLPGLAAGRFGVIMFFSACRLPSFAPEDPPSHASKNQITTG